jgi:hypothetical protein
MSQKNTTSDKSVKVISDARGEEILSIFRTLHGKVLTALQECEVAPQFNTDFAQCGAEDYKNLHQQSRVLISALRKEKNDKRVAGIRVSVQGVVDTHLNRAREEKSQYDAQLAATPENFRKFITAFPNVVKIPLSDIRACFPTGATDKQVWDDLTYMGYKVTDLSTKGQVIVPFVPAPTKEEKAPESGEAPKSVAA